jgi:hypothetical protein
MFLPYLILDYKLWIWFYPCFEINEKPYASIDAEAGTRPPFRRKKKLSVLTGQVHECHLTMLTGCFLPSDCADCVASVLAVEGMSESRNPSWMISVHEVKSSEVTPSRKSKTLSGSRTGAPHFTSVMSQAFHLKPSWILSHDHFERPYLLHA